MTFRPTDEQQAAVDLFATDRSLVVTALAGTGKTSTLKLMAESTQRRGRYCAFNRAIVNDAKARMPSNVIASTLHSLAFGTVGKRFAHRLDSVRMRSDEIARILRVDPMWVNYGGERKVLQPGFLAGRVMQATAIFCSSAEEEPSGDHLPYIDGIDLPDADGNRTWTNNREVRRALSPAIRRAWADLSDPNGQLRFSHDVYKKIYCLGNPQVASDFLMVDEAQDLTPCDEAFVARQRNAQVVLVGDSQQAIYGWKGCRDSLGSSPIEDRTALRQSFRFGDTIAAVANRVLTMLESELLVIGTPGREGRVDVIPDPDAILCRTNAQAIIQVLSAQQIGRKPYLVGGASQVSSFARAAQDLKERGRTSHPELCPFTSWGQVQDYVAHDPLGSELKLMVNLVDEFGVDVILAALDSMPQPRYADLTVGTAHAVKGLQWPKVVLAGDFPEGADDISPEELRLLYVAVTRAQRELDISACGLLAEQEDESGEASA